MDISQSKFEYIKLILAVIFFLATVMSFVNNYVEMRVMAWRLCQLSRRPEPRSCEGYSILKKNILLILFLV
jgi:hypothetical protein